ncbi:MAG TPA: hypothetical protein VHZ95_18180 [Polyangiales bacterium]|nr:hypothetical protein [Polyangiales bacterium]
MKRHVIWTVLLAACSGTTGGERTSFAAVAFGPSAADGGMLSFDSGAGYAVALTRAHLHVGAIYLNQSVPSSGSQETSCVLPGIYVAQVTGPLDIDALSSEPQPFPEPGEGIGIKASAAELWLNGGDINATDDTTVILDAAGTASKEGVDYPFEASLTIGQNRAIPSSDPALPGANPICKQRIVTPIAVDLTPVDGGTLQLQVDPRGWFNEVDFSTLPKSSDDPSLYRFADAPSDAADVNIYSGLRSRAGAYEISWKAGD